MIQASFNNEILWLTEDGWNNLKDLLKEGDKIEILEVDQSGVDLKGVKMKKSIEDIAVELEGREYYSTVAWGYIVEAVAQAVSDLGTRDVDKIDKYIRAELI